MATPLKLRLISSNKFEKPLYAVASGDLDGDGKIEIATGCGDAYLRIFKYERGKLTPVWNARFWAWIDQIVVTDVDQDYIYEFIVITGRKLFIYKYKDHNYEKVWEFEAPATITSACVGDANNDRKQELLIGCNDGSITIFGPEEDPFNFKPVWKKKYEGDTLVRLADLDADTLNEIVVVNNNVFRVFRAIEKYPKKESAMETLRTNIKQIMLFDLNSDKKSEIFLGLDDGSLRIFSHKDGDYFSEDKQYKFENLVSAFASGRIRDKEVVVVGSYDKTVRAFHDVELFQIETYDKIYSISVADIDQDGKDEVLCGSGNTLYVFKEDVILTCQIEAPIAIFADKEFVITYFVKNNSENRIYNMDLSNLDWSPKILTLSESKFKIPILEKYSGIELSFRFTPQAVQKLTQIIFPPVKITFEMNNQQLSQMSSEIKVNLLPPFAHMAQIILNRCEHFKNTTVPLKTLAKVVEKELGPIEPHMERLISRLIDEKFIKGTIVNWMLYIQDIKSYSEAATVEDSIAAQKMLTPQLFMSALRNSIKSKKRTLLLELTRQYNRRQDEIEETLKKLKANFEITGILIPNEEFLYLKEEEINAIAETINNSPNVSFPELMAKFDFSEKELKVLLNDLITLGILYGQIITIDGVTKFVTTQALSKIILDQLNKEGKLTILTYSRKIGIDPEVVREGIRMLLDSKLQGTYTFNGAIFYTQSQLEKELINTIRVSEINSIGLNSLAKDFMISKEAITLALSNLINKQEINGYISENTLFLKSYEEERLRDIFEKYADALNIIHILVIHRESGVAIFSGSYTREKIDPSLVSGFLHAITSFGSEISGTEGSLRLLEYRGFRITIQEGEFIRSALILKEDPSQRLLEIIKHFVRFFDTNYREHLEHFSGFVDPFKNAGDLVDDFFEVSLSFPHEIQEKEVFKNRDHLSANELALINMARSLGREFSLSSLIEKSSKDLLISQLEAFSIIYNLREKKIFQVITEERKWCPYCGSIIQKAAKMCPHCQKNIEETSSGEK